MIEKRKKFLTFTKINIVLVKMTYNVHTKFELAQMYHLDTNTLLITLIHWP